MRWTFLLVVLLFPLLGAAQVMVFETFEDFTNQKGVYYDEYKKYKYSIPNVKLIFVKDGKKVKIDCADIWGFVYKDALFRMDQKRGHPTRVMSAGKICYYENGLAHLNMIKFEKELGGFSVGFYCYISKDLNSEVLPFPLYTKKTTSGMELDQFRADHPEYEDLFACFGKEKYYQYETVRPCVEAFEGKSMKKKDRGKGEYQKN